MKSYPKITLSFLLLILVVSACKREPVSVIRVGSPTMAQRLDPCAAKVEWWSDNKTEPTRFRLRGAESSSYLMDTAIQGNSIELFGLVQPGKRYVYEVSQGEDAFEQEFLMRSIGEQYIGRRKVTVTYSQPTPPYYFGGEAYLRVTETAEGLRLSLEDASEMPLPDLHTLQFVDAGWNGANYAAGDSIIRTTATFLCFPETGVNIGHYDNRPGIYHYWSIGTR